MEKRAFDMDSEKEAAFQEAKMDVGHCWPCQAVLGGGFVFCLFLHLNKLFSGRQCCIMLIAIESASSLYSFVNWGTFLCLGI